MERGDIIADRFEIERLAGAGGMSEIYRARDVVTGQVVALKRLTGSARTRFDLEVRVLSQLEHPGVVRYVAHGETERGDRWLAMEWIEGESLAAALTRGPLTVVDTLALGLRVADALGAAHARGMVHRDIKPENLLLVGGHPARVKLLDFGIVRVGKLPRETRVGTVLGTLGYMAPEQARGETGIDARADVYALGCVLHECLAGAPAFAGDDVLALLAKIVLEEAPRVRERRAGVPEALDDLISRMLHKDPARRPRDAGVVAAELAELADGSGVAPSRRTGPRPELTQGERRMAFVVLVGPGARGEPADEAPIEVLRAAVEARHGRLDALADGSLAAAMPGAGIAEDRAVQAADCAMALRVLLPGRPIALAVGRSEGHGGRPAGDAVDRAARMLFAGAVGVAVDEVGAALLDRRFEVQSGPSGLRLCAQLPAIEAERTLLGRATPCVGRDRELDALLTIFERTAGEVAGASSAHAVLLTAPPGFGKSRLARELALRLDGAVEVWVGRGDPSSAGSAFSVLAGALRRTAGLVDGDPIALRREKLRARVARVVPEGACARVAAFLGEIVGAPFPGAAAAELGAARRDPVLMGDQIRRAWVELVRAECVTHSLMVVLDDLHWGDLPTVQLVDAALRELAHAPLLVLAVGRPELHERFPKLWAEHDVTELRLSGLAPPACAALVREVLGERADPATTARIVEQADGDPLFLEELIRASTTDSAGAMPETVLAMVETRLLRLSPETRRALRAASVFGGIFWSGAVAALLGDVSSGASTSTTVRLDELVAEELVVRRPVARFAGEDELEFRHGIVREAAYAMLTEEDRRLGHQLAGEWLEHAGETDTMVLAAHFEAGEDPARAVGWYLGAAQQAFEGNDLEAVLARAARGVACGATGEALGTLEQYQAEACRWRGDTEAAEQLAARALEHLAAGGPLWFAAARELSLTASGDTLRAAASAIRAAPRDESIAAAQLGALAAAHGRLLSAGHVREAAELLPVIEAFADLGAARDPAAAAAIHDARAQQALHTGDAAAFLRFAEEARASFAAAGDRRNAAARLIDIGRGHALVGADDDAERTLRDAAVEASRFGLGGLSACARGALALSLARLGRLEEARGAAVEAVAVAASHAAGGHPEARRREGAARTALSTILLLLGEEEGPERQARRAVEATEGHSALAATALAALAEILLGERRPEDALAVAREALAGSAGDASAESAEVRARLAVVEALAALGEPAAARAALTEARSRLLMRAAAIRDTAMRAGFLEGVPENARTLALSRLAGLHDRAAPPLPTPRRQASHLGADDAVSRLSEAQRALSRCNPDAAIARAEQGMNHVATGEVRAELRAVMSRAQGFRNAWGPAHRWAEQGLREATPGSRGYYKAFAAHVLAAAELGVRDELVAAADALPRLGVSGNAAEAAAVALSALSYVIASIGETDRAMACFDRMERVVGPLSPRDPLVRGHSCRARAERARSIEQDPWTALRLDEAAREAFVEAGEAGEAALSLAHVGIDRWQLGAYERAEEALRAAREAGGRGGYLAALTSVHLAWTLAGAGRLTEAGAELYAGSTTERLPHNPSLKAAAAAALAEVLRRRGELTAATLEGEAVIALPGAGPLVRTAAMATVAAAYLAQRKAREALEYARRARTEREAQGLFGFCDAFVRLVHIEALLANGDVVAARAPMSRAYARLLVHASKIGDPALRASFLERVPENARTLSLARRWLGDAGDHAFR